MNNQNLKPLSTSKAREIGAKGGKACVPKGFASNRDRARLAGIKGCEARLRNMGVIE
jgi:general stress protein YciG